MLRVNRSFVSSCVLALIASSATWFSAAKVVGAEAEQAPELVLPLGHSGTVLSAAMSGDCRLVLTGSADNTAILWDVGSAKPVRTFRGHTDAVRSVAMSGDGKLALTGSRDKTAILWDAESAKPVRTFIGHTGGINSVALSRNCKRVLTGSDDGIAILWDAETAKPVQTFKGHTGLVESVALSQDGKHVLTGSTDDTAILWDEGTGRRVQTFERHLQLEDSRPDRRTPRSAAAPALVTEDPRPPSRRLPGARSVALSGDGRLVLTSGSYDKAAILWDAATARSVQVFRSAIDDHGAVLGADGEIVRLIREDRSVAMSGDGRLVLTGLAERPAVLWDAGTAKPVRTFGGYSGNVSFVSLSADGKRALTGSSDFATILWDTDTATPIQTFKGRADEVASMASSADGKWLVTGSKTAILWDAETAKPVQNLKGHALGVESVACSGDGTRVLTATFDRTSVLWVARSARPIQTFKGSTRGFMSVALSGDGRRVLAGGWDKTAILWDDETGVPIRTFKGHTGPVTSVAMSGDGKRFLTGSRDQTAILWDAETAKALHRYGHSTSISSVALSRDGKRVLTGSWDKTAVLWDAQTAKPIQTFNGHTGYVSSVALSADGKRVLTGSYDWTAILWDSETAKPVQTFKGHNGDISSVAFVLNDSFVITASRDRTVRFWRQGHGQPILSLLMAGDDWLTWTPEGYYSCSPNGENLIAWKIADNSLRGYRFVGPEQFRKKFRRPDLFRHLLGEVDLTRALAKADVESGRTVEAPTNIALALPPNVAIVKPDRDGETGGEKLTVDSLAFSVGDHPVTRMRLLIDGRPYQGNLSTFEIPEPRLGKVRWSKEIDLEPGEHTIQVIAESISEGRSEILRVRRKAVVETLPRLFVLAVGVSAYQKEELLKDVFYAAADARSLRTQFSDRVSRCIVRSMLSCWSIRTRRRETSFALWTNWKPSRLSVMP